MKVKALILILITSSFVSYSQNNTDFKKEFLKDLNSTGINDACQITLMVLDAGANAACFVPDPTVSKVACGLAQIINLGVLNPMVPDAPNPVSQAGEVICRVSYAAIGNSYTFTLEFIENQHEEILRTWDWINTLEGSVELLIYLKL